MAENDLPVSEIAIFLTSLLVNLAIAVVLFFVLGGRELMSRRIDRDELDDPTASGPGRLPAIAPARQVDERTRRARRRLPRPRRARPPGARGASTDQVVTLVAFVAVAVVALVFDKNIGFAAITAAVILTALFPKEQKGAVKQIAWPTVLLVAGVSTFAAILNKAGARSASGKWAAGLGAVVIGALVLCYVGGIVSAFASSTALLPIIVPIAIPLIADGERQRRRPSSPRSRCPRRSSTSARSRPTAR